MNLSTNCPICRGDWYNIIQSEFVCEKHLDWIVSVCPGCEVPYFTDDKKTCPQCVNYELEQTHSSEEAEIISSPC